MPIVIPSGSDNILFVAEVSASLDYRHTPGNHTGSGVMGVWEIDPADGKSVQFRIPKSTFGGDEDRIPFYVSSSGRIGIGTNDPETEIELKTTSSRTDSHRFGPTRISGSLNVIGNITSGDINGGSF